MEKSFSYKPQNLQFSPEYKVFDNSWSCHEFFIQRFFFVEKNDILLTQLIIEIIVINTITYVQEGLTSVFNKFSLLSKFSGIIIKMRYPETFMVYP